MRRYRTWLWTALATGFFFRVAVAIALGPQHFPDSEQYKEVADSFRAGRGFATAEGDRAVRTPGYPILLAPIRAMSTKELPVRLAQALLGALTAWLAAFWLRPRLGDVAALAAAILLSLDPFLACFASLELVEILEGTLLLATLVLACVSFENGRKGLAAGAGLAAAATALVHPAALPLVFAIGAALGLAGTLRKGLPLAAAYFGALVALYSPWVVRNAVVLRAFVPATTQVGTALYEAFGPGATGGISRDVMAWPRGVDALPEVQRNSKYRAMAAEAILKEPGRAIGLVPKKWAHLWNPVSNAVEYRSGLLVAASLAWNIPVYLLALAGAWLGRRQPVVRWAFLAILGLTLIHMFFLGSLRYRMPVMPEVEIAAAAAVAAIAKRLT